MNLLAGIRRNDFLVIGRAGMDLFSDPPGTRTEEAVTFTAGLGGSSANIAAGICKFGGKAALVTAGTVFAAEPSRRAAFKAFALARAVGLPIVFDVDYRPYSWPSAQVAEDVLSRADALADVIVGNDEGFGVMAGGFEKGVKRPGIWPPPPPLWRSTRWAKRAQSRSIAAKCSAPGSIPSRP